MTKNRFAAVALSALVALAVGTTAPAFARGGAGGSGGMHGQATNVATSPHSVHGTTLPAGFSHGQRHGWGTASTPPGWSHGKKKGWGSGTRPPGLSHH